uniref:Galectin n=1 Tax=Angiostrongylus cantonensis TaxID=6313 RepID=A0A0K0DFF0_ANGCA
LFPGRAIVVSGMVLQQFASDSKRFCIDLCCGLLVQGDHMDNKALHINPRFDVGGGWFSGHPDRQLVINSYISNRWCTEERFPNPFEPGKPFQLRILVLENYFKIAVNGKHVCDYPHRVPVEEVKTIYIGGNIRVDFIEFQPAVRINNEGAPLIAGDANREEKVTTLERPLIPFSWVLPAELNGFVNPQSIRFTLTPYISGKRFTCNLLAGEEHFFHFRVDFRNQNDKGSKDAVVRGSTKKLVWQKEERDITTFPFSKGITSDVLFVDVDGVPFLTFSYRDGDDPKLINRVTVNGDCVLHRFVHKA